MLKKKFFLLGLTFTILVWFLLTNSFFKQNAYLKVQNDIELLKLFEMDKCIKDKQIPCRWVPDLGFGYGYPLFNYEAPLPFYIGEVVYFLTHNFQLSLKIIYTLSFAGGYIFIYLLASRIRSQLRVILAIFYSLFCIYLATFENGLGLVWQLMFFPLTLLSINMLSKIGGMKNSLFFAISLALLILAGNPRVVFLAVIGGWIIYKYIQTRKIYFLFYSAVSILFAFLLSAFYIFPSLLERDFVHNISEDPYLSNSYFPKSVREKPKDIATPQLRILTGDSDVLNFTKGTNWLRFETETKTHTIIRLSQYYFPDWKIFIDGSETQIEYLNNSFGFMNIIVGEGHHLIEGRLFDTPLRSISNFITLVSAVTVLLLLIVRFKKTRYWINYYKKRIN